MVEERLDHHLQHWAGEDQDLFVVPAGRMVAGALVTM